MPPLEQELELELLRLHERWKSIGPPRNYFLQMVKKTKNEKRYKGAVGTVRYLLQGAPSSGFKDLVRAGKLKLNWTVEALILDPKWKPLFTELELQKAAARIRDATKTGRSGSTT
jgi:hypothetical protein